MYASDGMSNDTLTGMPGGWATNFNMPPSAGVGGVASYLGGTSHQDMSHPGMMHRPGSDIEASPRARAPSHMVDTGHGNSESPMHRAMGPQGSVQANGLMLC